jgi:SAM-dependent methyltransferase
VERSDNIGAEAAHRNSNYGSADADYGVWEIPGLLDALPRNPGAEFRILEIGCCFGHSAAAVKAAYPNAEVVAGDIVEDCLTRVRELYPDLETARLDADRRLPFDDGEFDYAFSSNLFEHLFDDAAHLAEVRRVLKPGGDYIISTPNLWIELVYWGLMRPEQGTRWASIWPRITRSRSINHCNLQTIGSLSRRLREAGFKPRAQRRGDLSNTEARKLRAVFDRLPKPVQSPAYEAARGVWRALPSAIQPSIVVIGTRP